MHPGHRIQMEMFSQMENILQVVLVPKPRIIAQPTTADSLVSSWQLVWWYAVGGIFKYISIFFLFQHTCFCEIARRARNTRRQGVKPAFPEPLLSHRLSVFMPYFVWTPDLFTFMQVAKKSSKLLFSPLLHVQKWRAAWSFKNTVTPRWQRSSQSRQRAAAMLHAQTSNTQHGLAVSRKTECRWPPDTSTHTDTHRSIHTHTRA